jgi:hypothetical protein
MAYLPNSLTSQLTGIAVPAIGTVGSDLLRINEVDPMFTNLNNGSALLYRMLSMYRKDTPATQPQYWFFEDDQYAVKTTLSSAYTDGGGTVALTDAIAVAGTVLFFPAYNTAALVTAVSGGNCTITEDHMGTTTTSMAAGTEVVMLGATLAEGGTANGGIVRLPTKIDNMVSFFSQSVTSTDLQEVTDMLNGVGQINGEFANMTLLCMRQMDLALRYSKGGIGTKDSKTAYYTKGLEQYVTTDAEIPADPTWKDFNTLFNDAFLPTNSSPTKTLICSQACYSRINDMCFDRWTANPAFESTIGATMGQVALDGGGVIDVVLDKHGFTTAGKQGYLLDMPYVSVKPFTNFELNWRDITQTDDHLVKHEIFGSTSLKVQLASLHRTISLA